MVKNLKNLTLIMFLCARQFRYHPASEKNPFICGPKSSLNHSGPSWGNCFFVFFPPNITFWHNFCAKVRCGKKNKKSDLYIKKQRKAGVTEEFHVYFFAEFCDMTDKTHTDTIPRGLSPLLRFSLYSIIN